MPFHRRTITVLAASLILPPLGLILLWLRRDASVTRRLLCSVAILAVGVAELFLVYGLRMELSGGFRPIFSFPESAENRDAKLERHRGGQPSGVLPAPAPGGRDAASPAAAPAGIVAEPTTGSTCWSDFRGVGRLGRYDEKAILTEWPAGGLRLLWKQPVGGGYASFTAANGLAFTIEQRRGNEVVAAYEIRTGRERWTSSWPAFFQESLGGDGPRATPVWDDGRVYALGAEGELRCLEAATGKTVWRTNILSENGAANLKWGMAASPLVVDGKVIVTPGGPGGRGIVAYEKRSGKRVWGSQDDQAAYASPVSVTLGGRRQLLVMMASRVVGLAPEDGKLLWEYAWSTQEGINATEPIVVGPSRVYVSSGYGHGAAVIELSPQGDGYQARAVWTSNRMKNKFNGAVLHEGHIYGLDEGILACIEVETGALKWKGGRYGYGQTLLASGHIVALTEDGDVVLIRASPDRLQEKARFSALSGKTWNVPAITDGILLVRNEREMAAFRIGAD